MDSGMHVGLCFSCGSSMNYLIIHISNTWPYYVFVSDLVHEDGNTDAMHISGGSTLTLNSYTIFMSYDMFWHW